MNPTLKTGVLGGRVALIAAVATAGLTFSASHAFAVNSAVKAACLGDYFSYCRSYAVGSARLRQCMSQAGARLSPRCVSALVAAGEVSKAEVARRAANKRR